MTVTNHSTSTSNRSLSASPAVQQSEAAMKPKSTTSILKKASPERYNIAAQDSPPKVPSNAPTATFGESSSLQAESAAELAMFTEIKRKNKQLEEEVYEIRSLLHQVLEHHTLTEINTQLQRDVAGITQKSSGSGGGRPPGGDPPKRYGGSALPGADEPHLAITFLKEKR